MNKARKEIIESMKSDLLKHVDEWVGMDIPVEGTEDYEPWQLKLHEIDTIENIQDVIEYVERQSLNLDDFFLCGEYQVLSAGLDPDDVPQTLVAELGELIAEQSSSEESWGKVYLFDGKYFVFNVGETKIVELKADALEIAGIRDESFDHMLPTQEHQTNPLVPEKSRATMEARGKRKAVLIVVINWPSGTMALKFGSMMQTALNVSKDKMDLLQMAPERIFRVETEVSEAEFRDAMKSRGMPSGDNVLFIEISETLQQ